MIRLPIVHVLIGGDHLLSDNTDNQIERVRLLAIDFRKAIDRAQEAGELFHTAIAFFQ